jgi:outer membrane protein assembly factor BamB
MAAIQGPTLFRRELWLLYKPPPATIRRVIPLEGDSKLLVLFATYPPPQSSQPIRKAFVIDFLVPSPTRLEVEAPLSSWWAASAATSSQCFLGTNDGTLYRGVAADGLQSLVPFGRCPGRTGTISLIECPGDGSIVIVLDEHLTAWNSNTGVVLWQQEHPTLRCFGFVPGSNRLIGGMQNGEIVELDPLSGQIVGRMARCQNESVSWVVVSPDGKLLAAIDRSCHYFMVDLATGELLWSRPFAATANTAAFSADSNDLLITNPELNTDLGVVCVKTGEIRKRLVDNGHLIKGIAILSKDAAVVWKHEGMMAKLNLSTGEFSHHFNLAMDGTLHTGPGKWRPVSLPLFKDARL